MPSFLVRLTRNKALLLFVRIAVTLPIGGYLYLRMDWEVLAELLRQVDPVKLSTAALLHGCGIVLSVFRWRALLADQAIHLGWWHTARLALTGLFFNLFFLGSAGGDAAKFIGTVPHVPRGKARVALSLVQDRIIGLGALLLVLTGFILSQLPVLTTDHGNLIIAVGIPAACATYFSMAAVLWYATSAEVVAEPLKRGSKPGRFNAIVRSSFPKSAFRSMTGLSAVIHVLVVVAGYLAARAVGLSVSFTEMGVVLGISTLALSLPITIAGIGVRDGMLIWTLALFGFNVTEEAIALSTCLLGISLFWALVGGGTYLWSIVRTQTTASVRS